MKRALYQTTRRLTQSEISAAMESYPRPMKREPVVRIRTVFLAAFCTGVFSALIIIDPMAKLAGCMR